MTIINGIDTNEIKVSIADGPIGSHGFRRGHWPVVYQGRTYEIYTSVPHGAEFDVQREQVRESAARIIGNATQF